MSTSERRKRANASKSRVRNSCLINLIGFLIFLTVCTSFLFSIVTNVNFDSSQHDNDNASHSKNSVLRKKNNIVIEERNSISDSITIGYAVSVTGCSNDQALIDAAAVLRHSIHINSIRNDADSKFEAPPSSSKYNYQMLAIVHPNAMGCIAEELEHLGYQIHEKDIPVPVDQIEGKFLREKVVTNGCCGEKEFIKLWSFTLTQYPIVVHLDLDTVVFKPLDPLFDMMLTPISERTESLSNSISPMWTDTDRPLPENINAYFTRDYNMANPKKKEKHVGVQGGLFIVKPDMARFEDLKQIIKKGDFQPGTGWGGLNFGPFYGAMTFQGIIPYFYDAVHPNTAVELNRCFYNNMGDNPRTNPTRNNIVSGDCRDGREDCEDCREVNVEDVSTAHFTLCQKPWLCMSHSSDQLQHRLCRKMHHKWFQIRADLEGKTGDGHYDLDHFAGFCSSNGKDGYIPLNTKDISKYE